MPRFGSFEVDFRSSEMRKSRVRVRIQAQPLRILEILLERPNESVTRDELRERLWPSDTFVNFEPSLNAAVGKLRQALNDSADRPRYIETVARIGYRFVAPLYESKPEPAPPPNVQPSLVEVRHAKVRWVLAGALATILLIVWLAAGPFQRAQPEKRVVRLDLDAGSDVSDPAISQPGQTLVFVAGSHLAVRRLDEGVNAAEYVHRDR